MWDLEPKTNKNQLAGDKVGHQTHQLQEGLYMLYNLPESNSEFTPENGWLEYERFLLGWPIFRCELLVSGRVSLLLFRGEKKQ